MILNASDIALQVAKQKDEILMRQLEWLVSRNILVIESKPGKFLQKSEGGSISYHEEIELVVKDKEYIEKLESEIKALKNFKQTIIEFVAAVEAIK